MKSNKYRMPLGAGARHQLKNILDSVDDLDTVVLEISVEESEPNDYPDAPHVEIKCITEVRI